MEINGNPWKSMEIHVGCKIDTTKFNLLPNERLESFWDALWLGIRTFLCFKMSNWSHFGIDLGSLGGHFGVIFGTWEPLCGTWEPLGVTLDPLRGTWG